MQYQFFTVVLVVVTVLVSLWGFQDRTVINRFLLYPQTMRSPSEFHRFLTHGFIHADQQHLIFNMIALFSFGSFVEGYYAMLGVHYLYLVLYLSGIVVASLPSYIKHRNNPYYGSLGASGGTAAVMFSMVYLAPWEKFSLLFMIPMWAILFAVLYLAYSAYMARQQKDNIAHDAHFMGAIYGFVFTYLCDPLHGQIFIQQIMNPPFLHH
jgi:membrane associated rhomboid family serine protease